MLRESPVDHHGLAVLAYHHVRRLEIAMDDVLGMRVRHGLAGIDHVPEKAEAIGQRAAACEAGLQRLSPDQLLRAEESPVLAARELVDGNYAGMIERGDQPHFAQEAGDGPMRRG